MTHPIPLTNKAGLLPWRVNAQGEREYLIQKARPKEDPANPGHAKNGLPLAEEAQAMQWGLARGTVQRRDGTDIRSPELLRSLPPEAIEAPLETALREAQEELGITRDDLAEDTIRDEGLLNYASKTSGKGTYAIHFFSAQAKEVARDTLRERASGHTQDVMWASVPQLHQMAESGTFKAGYLAIVEAIHAAIP